MSDTNEVKCIRCQWVWLPMYDTKPKVCPRCKSYSWDKPYQRRPPKQEKK